MGLDWLPIAPRKKEVREDVYKACQALYDKTEKEVDEMYKKFDKKGMKDEAQKFYAAIDEHLKYKQKLREMTVDKGEIMGVPKVGYDKEATDFMVAHIRETAAEIEGEKKSGKDPGNPAYAAYWSRPEAEILVDEWGRGIGDLAKSSKGAGAVTGMMLVGMDSFRGKCLGECQFLGNLETHEDMTPEKMLEFADKLEKQGKEFAKKNHLKWDEVGKRIDSQGAKDKVTKVIDALDDENMDAKRYSIWVAYKAIEWLRFWAKKGFSLNAWY